MTSPVDKLLEEAVTAARDHANEDVSDGAATRLRLRESLANHGATRRKRFTLISAVIASLFGSTAFAYWAGWRPPWSEPEAVVEARAEEASQSVSMRLPEQRGSASAVHGLPETTKKIEEPTTEPAIPDAGLAAEVPPTPAPPPAPVEVARSPRETTPAPVRTVPRVRTSPVEPAPLDTTPAPTLDTQPTLPPAPAPAPHVPAPVEPKPQPSAEIAAYRHAHQLHFRGNDPEAALAAWDDYLAKYPDGALAPEARYDRALVLVKLARWAEARAELAPFANAKAGSYRQKEAAEILAAIRAR